jgi:hypothetical protein
MKPIIFLLSTLFFLASPWILLAQDEPVWPGTQTRFYPGIYPRSGTIDPSASYVTNELNSWWGSVDKEKYREYHNGQRVSHIGIMVLISPKSIFSDYWYNHEEGPYNYFTT